MTIGACARRRLVEKHIFTIYRLDYFVACGAGYVFVPALEREVRRVVVEKRGLPLIAVVAPRAVILLRAELVGMRIFVAFVASFGRVNEAHMHKRALKVRRLMAIRAGDGAMRAHERELCGVVVEVRQLVPVLCVVADFATVHRVVARCRHSFVELAPVHVFMTRGAAQLREVVANQLLF